MNARPDSDAQFELNHNKPDDSHTQMGRRAAHPGAGASNRRDDDIGFRHSGRYERCDDLGGGPHSDGNAGEPHLIQEPMESDLSETRT